MYHNLTEQLGLGKVETQDPDIPKDFVKFNEMIGLPRHPQTHEPSQLAPFQLDFFEKFIGDTESSKHKKYIVNKGRQVGFTELVVRILLYKALTCYKPGIIIVIAGTRVETTKQIMSRFHPLLDNIPSVVEDRTDLRIKLRNGIEILGFPSNSNAIRGLTGIRACFMDEAAHFEIIDDSVVVDAILPAVEASNADLVMISTPRGPRGFFYEIEMSQNDYVKLKFPIWVTKGHLYTEDWIRNILKRTDIDVDQEYLNQYTTSRNSIFGNAFPEGDFAEEVLNFD